MANRHNPYYYNPGAYGVTGLEQYGIQETQATPVRAMGSMATTGLSMAGMGVGIGAAAMGLDPMSLGYGAFKRVINPTAGKGIAGFGNVLKTIGSGKVGLGRLGMAAGAAALPALGAYAASEAIQWGAGQMVRGAGIQAGMESALGSSNFGYNGGQMRGMNMNEVTQMFRDVYDVSSDMKRGVQEITGVITSMRNLNLTQSISGIREFRAKFKETAQALNQVASEYGVTLREAEAYFRSAKAAGFSTMKDQLSSMSATRQAEWATGMNRAQVQSAMSMGTQLSRAVGGTGWRGAIGMSSALRATGAGLTGGVLSEQMLEEATGKTGAEATVAFSNMMQRAIARRGSTKFGRYFLAAAARDDMRGLDQDKLNDLFSGAYTMDDIKKMGREAAYGKGNKGMADRLLMYEEEMRGQLLQQGPRALMGMVRAEFGDRIYDTENYKVNRDIRRRYGLSKRAAENVLRMARRSSDIDAEQSYQEFERQDLQMSGYAEKGPLAQIQARIGKFVDDIGKSFQQAGQKVSVGLRDTTNRFVAAITGTDYTPYYKRRGPVRQTIGSRSYIQGLLSGDIAPTQRGGYGGPSLAEGIFRGAGILSGGESMAQLSGGGAFRSAGFSSAGELSKASSGLGSAWEEWTQSADLAELIGMKGFAGQSGMSRADDLIASIRRQGGRLADYLGNDPRQALARYSHLSRKYGRAGSLLRADVGPSGGRKPVTALSDARVNEIMMGMLSPAGAASEITHAMPQLNFGKPGFWDKAYGDASQWAEGLVGLAGHGLNLGIRAASGGRLSGIDMEDSFGTSLRKTYSGAANTVLNVGRIASVVPTLGASEGVIWAAKKFYNSYIDRDEEEAAADSAQQFRGFMGSKYGALLVRAANGDKGAESAIKRITQQADPKGISKRDLTMLKRFGARLSSPKGRASILKAAPLIYGREMKQYQSRVAGRMDVLEQNLTNSDRMQLSKIMGTTFDYGETDITSRGENLGAYFGKFMELDASEQQRVMGIYKSTGMAGSEFTQAMKYMSGVSQQMRKYGMDKGKEVGGDKARLLLSNILGRGVSKKDIKALTVTGEGEMSVDDIASKFGLSEKEAARLKDAMGDKKLSKEEASGLASNISRGRSASSYVGSEQMEAVNEVVNIDKEDFGSAPGMHKELAKQTGILTLMARKTLDGDKLVDALNEITGRKPSKGP
jgi:hypothetical protein